MTRENGYIKLHRKMLENPVVTKDAEHLAIWVYLLLEARTFPKEAYVGNKKIMLDAGQLTTGRKQIAEKLRVTESKVQRVLKCFESEQLIEQQTTRQNRLISIVKWNDYQVSEQPTEQQMNNKRTTSEQQMNTPKESKKERKNINIYSAVPSELEEAFMEWVAMRRKIKKPVSSEQTVKRTLNKLDKLANSTSEKIAILNQSTDNCWQDLYELKEKPVEVKKYDW